MAVSTRFNRSGFARFLNSGRGRVFRLVAGAGFLATGLSLAPAPAAWGLVAWSVLPLSAGAFDVCWISAALGGPLRGCDIRASL